MAIHWTEQKIDRLGKLWVTKSVKLEDIAAEFGIKKNSVRRAINRFYGTSLPKRNEHKPLEFNSPMARQLMEEHSAWLNLIKSNNDTKQQALSMWIAQVELEEMLRNGK